MPTTSNRSCHTQRFSEQCKLSIPIHLCLCIITVINNSTLSSSVINSFIWYSLLLQIFEQFTQISNADIPELSDAHILDGPIGLNIDTESETDESGYSEEACGCSRK